MELKDTIALMTSGDYKERFKAEHWFVKNKSDRLTALLEKWDAGRWVSRRPVRAPFMTRNSAL